MSKRALSVVAVVLLLGACGKVNEEPGAGDASSDGRASSDGATGDDASASSDGASSGDDSGIVGIMCDGTRCASANRTCCIENDTERCIDDTVSSCGGDRRKCMAASDCASGTVCCSGPSAAAPPRFYLNTTMCYAKCDEFATGYQLCTTDAECLNGKGCIPQQCGTLGTVKVCGQLPAGACQ